MFGNLVRRTVNKRISESILLVNWNTQVGVDCLLL